MKLENSDIKNIRLASVDVVEESDLGDRFEIDLIPEFKFFINGTLSDVKYNSVRDPKNIEIIFKMLGFCELACVNKKILGNQSFHYTSYNE